MVAEYGRAEDALGHKFRLDLRYKVRAHGKFVSVAEFKRSLGPSEQRQ
jgi:hypothetical protein